MTPGTSRCNIYKGKTACSWQFFLEGQSDRTEALCSLEENVKVIGWTEVWVALLRETDRRDLFDILKAVNTEFRCLLLRYGM